MRIQTPLPLIAILATLAAHTAFADVIINEFMASNGTTIADENDDYEDWIELLNTGTAPVDIGGWGLSDNPDSPFKWTFANGTLIAPGEFLLVWASGKDRNGGEPLPPAVSTAPDELPGLVAWFRADALTANNGDPVPTWSDSSGAENHATQPEAGQQPIFTSNAINGLPALTFGGTRQFSLPRADFNGMENLENFTFISVARWDGGTTSGLWGTGPSNANSGNLHFEITSGGGLRLRVAAMGIQTSSAVSTGWRMLAASQDNTFEDPIAKTFVNGQLTGIRSDEVGDTDLAGYGGFFLGNSHNSNRNFDGLIAEVAIFNRALDTTELDALHNHLREKYQLEGPPSAYDGPPLHTNFRLSSDGEPLVLTRPDGTTSDFIAPVTVPRDTSFGRQPDGDPVFHHFLEPTPGTSNTTQAYTAPVAPPDFSTPRGFHTTPVTLTLSHPDPDVEIYFSTDGSAPYPDSDTPFSTPLTIDSTAVVRAYAHKPGALPTSKVATHSYFFLTDILAQRDNPAALGFPTTWGTWTATHYGFDPEVCEDPAYAPLMEQAMTDIPTLSLVMEMDDLFDPDDGIYASRSRSGGAPRGEAWERPVSVEIIYPDGTREDFQINAGVRMQGGASRRADRTPKGSMRLLFKNIYETGTLQHALLGEEPGVATEFNTVILRAEYNNEWLHGSANQRRRGQYVRDQFIRQSQIAASGNGSRSTHVHLYLNGVYWGLYSPSERPDAAFGAAYYGGEREDWDAVTHRGLRDGNLVAWNTLNTLANANLAIQENYEAVLGYIDLPQYIDYMVVNLWAGMQDWPFNNWNAIRRREPGNGFMFFCWDSERSMENLNDNRTGVNQDAARFYDRMRANPEFRLAFADRVHRHFFNNGALTPAETIARYQAAASIVETAVIAESARWGSFRKKKGTVSGSENEIFTKNNHWNAEYNRLINDYLPHRTAIVLQQFRNANLYPSLDAPEISLAGNEILITADEPFHYTTDDTDPRLTGGAINPVATSADFNGGVYEAFVPVHLATTIKARALDGGNWSALVSGDVLQSLPAPAIIHQWDFENATTFLDPSVTVGGSTGIDVHIDPAANPTPAVVRHPSSAQGFDTAHLRVNNPIGATLTWHIPTTGFEGILIDFLSRRSGQGAGEQLWQYTTDGETWLTKQTLVTENDDPIPYQLDFRSTPAVNNNPDFAVRVTFSQADGGTEGNNRFDDFTVTGYPSAIDPNPPAAITFDAAPTGTANGSTLAPVIVRLLDESGNPATSFDGPVTLTLVGDGTLTGTTTVNAAFGTAIFENLTLTGTGTFQLTANAASLDPATTPTFQSLALTTLILPQYIQGEQDSEGDNNDRVPFAWQARIDGLAPLATYRIGNRVTLPTDAPDNDGAGNAILITSPTENWVRNTSSPRFRETDLNTRHIEITADATGSYTGWFITEPSGNARFTPGNDLHMRLLLNDGNGGEDTTHILTTTDSAQVLRFGTNADEGTAIIGQSSTAARRIVVLHDETTATTRPLAATPVEITGSETDSRYAAFYQTIVATNQSHWGTIIPNDLSTGLQRIDVHPATGDGPILDTRLAPAGFPGTIDPSGGLTTPILLDADAGLPIFLPGGTATWHTPANWSTASIPNAPAAQAIINQPATGNRNVNINAPATIGSLRVNQAATDHRNRIRDNDPAGTLTFNGGDGQPATIRIEGAGGEGHVDLDFDNPVTLATTLNLLVNQADGGDPQQGALRLQQTWTGPGGITKQGPGMASLTGGDKDFTGPLIIEQGALRITGPAVPANTTGVTILPGGQLRLVSTGTPEEPRIHTFGGGAIHIGGMGRGGDLPPSEQLGVLGALRYDPDSQDNLATLTNPLNLTATTDIHIDGTRNTLRLDGEINANTHALIKTGGGTLHLATDSPDAPPVTVETGTLTITAAYPASIHLTSGTTLTGNGTLTTLTGPGTVDPGDQTLTATTSATANYAFLFTDTTTGTLALTEITEAPENIDIHLDVASLVPGATFQGGLLLPAAYTLPESTTLNLLIAEEEAPVTYRDQTYRVATESDNLTWSIVETAEGHLIQVTVATGYTLWSETHFTPAELADETISGPTADPTNSGTPNLLRYALCLTPTENPNPRLPRLTDNLTYRFPIDLEKTDITYRVLTSPDLSDWSQILYDSTHPSAPTPTEGWLEIPILNITPRSFFRLEIELASNP